MHSLWYYMGLTDAGGWPYLLWSGIVGDFGLLGAIFVGWRHFECHADGCHRPGLHIVNGTRFKTCKVHHPTGGNSAAQIQEAHDN